MKLTLAIIYITMKLILAMITSILLLALFITLANLYTGYEPDNRYYQELCYGKGCRRN
jgi:hypothetical protein